MCADVKRDQPGLVCQISVSLSPSNHTIAGHTAAIAKVRLIRRLQCIHRAMAQCPRVEVPTFFFPISIIPKAEKNCAQAAELALLRGATQVSQLQQSCAMHTQLMQPAQLAFAQVNRWMYHSLLAIAVSMCNLSSWIS